MNLKTLMGFDRAIRSMPFPWPLWIGLLVAANLIGPLYFLNTLEGKVVLAGFALGMLFQNVIFARKGFVRLLGLGHFHWLPMLAWISRKRIGE